VRDVGGPKQGEAPRSGGNHRPSGPRAVLETLRGIPERMRRPESLLLVMAIMASIGMHMPPYLGLGALADYFEEQERQHKKEELPPVTVDVVTQPESAQVAPQEPPPQQAKREKPKPKKKEPEKKKKQELAQKEPEKPKPDLTVQPKPELEPPPPPPAQRKQSITQKSQDPSVEPPPDARFIAEESQRVEEESVASVTSETRDDPKPKAAAPMSAEAERAGDSHQEEKGAQRGAEDDQQKQVASRQRQQTAEPPPSGQPTPAPSQSPRTPAPAPEADAPKETIIRDPLGTFVLAPSTPDAHDHDHGGGPSGAGGKSPNLKVSWRAFEETFGAEQLAQDRLPREAKRRGAGREKRWEDFRAAIENYVEGVKPGNTSALNAAADPFAAYLAAFHRNLHAEFAYDFVSSLPATGELGNPTLVTKVEIVVNADGSLDRVGVVKSSGNLMYDFGAYNAVHRGSPYPPTPEKIRSPDGRVYMRWALHRDQNMCGTWLAEPYILKSAPRSPNDPPQDNISPFLPGRAPSGSEHGSNEPKGGGKAPGKAPAVAPGETLGQRRLRVQPVLG
jgi:TonB family protein